jgi:predicted FMN-binding regulatory protein PaiB
MGAFGPRDFHRRPFEVLPNPIPLFQLQDERHRQLVELSMRCHQKVAKMKLSQSRAIGRLRRKVREDLRDELEKIDRLVKELLGL